MLFKYISFIGVITLSLLCVTPKTAAEVVVLTDEELDQIYGEGLNLNFDNFLGSINEVSEKVSKDIFSSIDTTAGRVISTRSSEVKIFEKDTSPQDPTAKLDTLDVKPSIEIAELSSLPTNTANSSESGTTVSTEVQPESVMPSVSTESLPSPDSKQSLSQPSSAAQSTELPEQQNAATQPVTFNVLAGSGGESGLEVAVSDSNGQSVAPPTFSANNIGAVNNIDIGGSAQENLSALVNVNAAGSVVPVMLNLTVIMNSDVGSINNSNQLNLSNMTTYRMM